MKIKEVEECVGISSNNIRFYEEMGLINIKRDPENKYREFQEEDIKRLQEIKLFRSLEITMEEIRRYYHQEITLEELMDHQVAELKVQHDNMQLKEKLCEDIKNARIPLVSYSVKQYDDIIQHKAGKTSVEKAGTLITSWNRTQYTKKRMLFMECLLFPLVWFWISIIVYFLLNLPDIAQMKTFRIEFTWAPMIITILLAFCICYYDYYFMAFPDELYEFREKGIYYVKKTNRRSFQKIRKAAKQNRIEEYMDFLPYEELEIFKVWFHVVAKVPLGANAYQLDFHLHSIHDEHIQINTGMIGVSDEKIRLTIEILKEKAKKVVDPFQIITHLDLDNSAFYNYLDEVYRRKEHLRVYGSIDRITKKQCS